MNGTDALEHDTFPLSRGELKIYFVGHGTLMLSYDGFIIHVDPVSEYADYTTMPKADVILVTHQHFDHLEKEAVEAVCTDTTGIFLDSESAGILGTGTVIRNGDTVTITPDIGLRAVPAYNTTEDRTTFHPKGRDNGYILSFEGLTVYIAGDTEPIPEMADLGRIDIAFLPMNQPYTMTPRQAAEAAATIKPGILYPYHYGSTDTGILVRLMGSSPTEVRIRPLA